MSNEYHFTYEQQQQDNLDTMSSMPYPHSLHFSQWASRPFYGHMPTASFDPSQPAFDPVYQPGPGMGLQAYAVPRSPQAPAIEEMKRYIVDMNVSHMNDKIRMEQRTNDNTRGIQELQTKCEMTYQMLEQRLREMEESDDGDEPSTQNLQAVSVVEPQVAKFPGYVDGQRIRLADHFYDGRYTKEELAHAYCAEADRAQRCAQRLTEHAEEILGHKLPPKAIERAPPNPGDKVIGFACCETAFSSVEELLAHVESAHAAALPLTHRKSVSPEFHTPKTDSRAHSKAQSHAIEIKDPFKSKTEGLNASNVALAHVHSEPVTWAPEAVKEMLPFGETIPTDHNETFTMEFLSKILQGNQWSPGFYFIAEDSILPSLTYWMLDAEVEPFLPSAPGQHGAKLTPFFHEGLDGPGPSPSNYLNVPVFIRAEGSHGYRYFGNYSQKRFSDKVSYDTLMSTMPDHVLRYWASQLAAVGRPAWVTQALMDQFWPTPKYYGRISANSGLNAHATATTDNSALERRVQQDLFEFAEELKAWKKDARLKATFLTEETIYNAFKKADLDIEPGLRLWWEYFECVAYDKGFYTMLVNLQNNPRLNTGHPGAKRPPTPVYSDNNSTAMKKGEIDEKGRPVVPAVVKSPPATEQSRIISPQPKPKPVVDRVALVMEKKRQMEQAAEDAKKPTIFVKPPFDFSRKDDKAVKSMSKTNTKLPRNHVTRQVVQETQQEKFGGNGREGFGERNTAEESGEEVKSGGSEGKGNRKGSARPVPPHLRRK